jgi:L-lactate utilization protein LutC
MPAFGKHPVLKSVQKALGRSSTPKTIPPPPELEEPLIRLVHSDFGLPELFAARARENKMFVEFISPEAAADAVVQRMKDLAITSVLLPTSRLLQQLGLPEAISKAGIVLSVWGKGALGPAYGIDAGLTDAFAAVAETGSIVIKPSATHGRAISLVPNYHLVVLEPRNFVPDLVDLFQMLATDREASGHVLITGPSKTADIEMNLVTGVHGPGRVDVFILR